MSTAEETTCVVALVETQAGTWTLRLKKGQRVLFRLAKIPTLDEARRRADVYVQMLGARVVETPKDPVGT